MENATYSRRNWLKDISLPTLATIGASFIGVKSSEMPFAKEDLPNLEDSGVFIYNIRSFGARGDGAHLDTIAVQKAIDTCFANSGGTVLIPAGNFIIGTIELKANVTLHISSKGRLTGSPNRSDYKEATGVPKSNGNVALIYGVNADNISIEGKGAIDGNGKAFYTGQGDNTGPGSTTPGYMDRPHLLVFYKCSKLRAQDVLLTQSAYHCFRILECNYVQLRGIQIYNRINKNNDGFHFGSSTYVHITNCDVKCQDDACALFGSNQFITISDCSFSTRWSIFRFGGGNSQNITVTNCLIYDTYGCPIKISAGRCQIENFNFSNITMRNVTGPISIGFSGDKNTSGNANPDPENASFLRNISFNNIEASVILKPVNHPDIPFDVNVYPGEQYSCISLNSWGSHYLENISFNNIHIKYIGGGCEELAAKNKIPEINAEYFGVWNTAPFGPPSYGLFARNVRGLCLQNVRFELDNPDARSAILLDNVQGASLNAIQIDGPNSKQPGIKLINSENILITGARLSSFANLFIGVAGDRSKAIQIYGSDFQKANKSFQLTDNASAESIKI